MGKSARLPQQKNLFTNRYRAVRRHEDECHSLHIPLVGILRWAMRKEVLWRHVPNGEHRDIATARKLKAMGVLPGCADLEFFWNYKGRPCALFMELKLPGRKLSEAQKTFANRISEIGWLYECSTSIDGALARLRALNLLRDDVRIQSLVYSS